MKTIRQFELRSRRVRVADPPAGYGVALRDPDRVVQIARSLIGDSEQEHFLVFSLDVKNRILGYTEAARGGIDACPVDPRTVFRAAIAAGASAIIAAHNHPSGDAGPSSEDLVLTERLKRGADLLGIALLDHVIVADDTSTSLAARGLL